jgi:hypothetical protein
LLYCHLHHSNILAQKPSLWHVCACLLMNADSFVIDLQQLDRPRVVALLKTLISSPWCNPDYKSTKLGASRLRGWVKSNPLAPQVFKDVLRCKPLFEVLSGNNILHLLEWSTMG